MGERERTRELDRNHERDRPRERSRSQRHRGPGLPLAELLLQHKILDERSVELLRRAAPGAAEEVLLSLGPEVRNPSAYVTTRLSQLPPNAVAPAGPSGASPSGPPPPPPPPNTSLPTPWRSAPATVLTIHCGGTQRALAWLSQEQVVEDLLKWRLLDEGSAKVLRHAPEHIAREVVGLLGPELRNPPAFVVSKIRELVADGGHAEESRRRAPAETFTLYHHGKPRAFEWTSASQVAGDLLRWGILDESSSDLLALAPDETARQVLAALGPDVRNPSAVVTTRLKELRMEGRSMDEPMRAQPENITVWTNGEPRNLEWYTKAQAIEDLVVSGVLDQSSGAMLAEAPDEDVKQIVASIGKEVRNPSAYVTKRLREAFPHLDNARRHVEKVLFHHNGEAKTLEWISASHAARELARLGVLDESSAETLATASEEGAKHIVMSIGPETRNPSAYVTKRVREMKGEALRPEDVRRRGGDGVDVHCKGELRVLDWSSKEQAIDQLMRWGILDDSSAGALGQVTDEQAKHIITSLGPDIRHPAALVMRKVKELRADLPAPSEREQRPLDKIVIYVGGEAFTLDWFSKEQAVDDLLTQGVIDEGCAKVLLGAANEEAKEAISALKREVRNPSAFLIRKLKDLQNPEEPPLEAWGDLTIYHEGKPLHLRWASTEAVARQLVDRGVLDESSAALLRRLPDAAARDLVAGIGPDVRNPSAYIVRAARQIMGAPPPPPPREHRDFRDAREARDTRDNPSVLPVYHNGARHSLEWSSPAGAAEQLFAWGVLDDRSAGWLAKLNENDAWNIVKALGPDVRNPSAFVTKEARKALHLV